MDDNKGVGFGILAVIAIILGIMMATGVFGVLPAAVAAILKVIGIASIVAGVGLVAVAIAVIVLAFKSAKKDPNADTKAEIRDIIRDKEQEIAKLKSRVAMWKMELRRNNGVAVDSYEANIKDAERRIEELQTEILDIKHKSDVATSQMNDAEFVKGNKDRVIDDYVDKAQYEKDYADALKELDGRKGTMQ